MNYLSSTTKSIIRSLLSTKAGIKKKEEICDIPCISVNDEQKFQKIIFRRDSELISSINGIVQKGKWTYIDQTSSFLIETQEISLLFKEPYNDKNILILQLDNLQEEFYCFVNEKSLQQINFEKYLEKSRNNEFDIKHIDLFHGGHLDIHNPKSGKGKSLEYAKGVLVNSNGEILHSYTGKLYSRNKKFMYHVKDGLVYNTSTFTSIELTNGDTVEIDGGYNTYHEFYHNLGRVVCKNWSPVEDGKYLTPYGIVFKILDSKVSNIAFRVRYKMKDGNDCIIEQQNLKGIAKGDLMFDSEENLLPGENIVRLTGRWIPIGRSNFKLKKKSQKYLVVDSIIMKRLSVF